MDDTSARTAVLAKVTSLIAFIETGDVTGVCPSITSSDWRTIEEALATPAPGAPAGFKTVPIEATPEMVEAICEMHTSGKWPDDFGTYAIAIRRRQAAAGYSAAVEAAPGAPGQEAAAVQAMSEQQIWDWWASENGLEDCNMCKLEHFRRMVRAVEEKLAALPAGAGEKTS